MLMGMRTFGQMLREGREKAGMEQSVLGRAAGLGPDMISRIEGGSRTPSLDAAVLLARAVGLNARDAVMRVISQRDPLAYVVLRRGPDPDMTDEITLDPVLTALYSLPNELQRPLTTLILRLARRLSGR